MSIELSNGVVLPDLPADVLAEYPYAFIYPCGNIEHGNWVFTPNPKRFAMIVSSDIIAHVPVSIGFFPIDVCFPINVDGSRFFVYDADSAGAGWVEVFELTDAPDFPEGCPDGYVLWSNHDILTVTGIDENYDLIIGTEIYFPSSVSTVPEIMSVTGEWLVSMAGHTRRLSGTSDKFTPEQMDAFYGALVMPEAGEITLQEKTVEPSTEAQEVVPDSGFGGLSKVSVGAARLEDKEVTPTTEDQVIQASSGYYGLRTVTVKAAEGGGGGEELQSVMEVSF